MRENTVRVHFIDGHTAIVPVKNIQHAGDEGARSGTALVDGKEIPIYNRVEWGFLWEEQKEYQSDISDAVRDEEIALLASSSEPSEILEDEV